MNTKINTAILGAVLAGGIQAQGATTFNLTNLKSTAAFSVSAGAAGGTTSTVDSGTAASTRTVTYTVTDLDLTGDSTFNDTAVFSLILTAVGGDVAINGENVNYGWGVDAGAGENFKNEIQPGETLSFAAGSTTVTFGDGGFTASVAFDGFSGVSTYWANGDEAIITGAQVTGLAAGDLGTGGSNVAREFTALSSGFTVGNNAGAGYAISNIDMQYTITANAVPEPSSTALLGLGGLALILRRRK